MKRLPAKSYVLLLKDIVQLLEDARRYTARAVNAILPVTYWEIGRRIVEFEQGGESLLKRLSADLMNRFGRGFSERNLEQMRNFYLAWPISQTLSEELNVQALSDRFLLPWSAYVRLLSVKNENARRIHETESLRGVWSVRQLERQINSQFYERTALSKSKAAMFKEGARAKQEDRISPEEEIKDPYIRAILERLTEVGMVEAHGVKKGRTYTLSARVYRSMGQEAGYIRQAGFDTIEQEKMVMR